MATNRHRPVLSLALTFAFGCGSSAAAPGPDRGSDGAVDGEGIADVAAVDAVEGALEGDVISTGDASLDGADASVDRSSDDAGPDANESGFGCPPEMARIGAFCVDRYEAYVVELREDGTEVAHSPLSVVDGLEVRAKSAGGVLPQGYISRDQADGACRNAGKRLCSADEFGLACRGDDATAHYPYGGVARVPDACNEGKGSPMVKLFGADASQWTYANFNDPRLNEGPDTLAPTGSHPRCASPYGVYDCVGNLNEWGADAPDARGHARSRGGSFVDSEINGPGCLYFTSAHEPTYHDFSTGFRCCKDAM